MVWMKLSDAFDRYHLDCDPSLNDGGDCLNVPNSLVYVDLSTSRWNSREYKHGLRSTGRDSVWARWRGCRQLCARFNGVELRS